MSTKIDDLYPANAADFTGTNSIEIEYLGGADLPLDVEITFEHWDSDLIFNNQYETEASSSVTITIPADAAVGSVHCGSKNFTLAYGDANWFGIWGYADFFIKGPKDSDGGSVATPYIRLWGTAATSATKSVSPATSPNYSMTISDPEPSMGFASSVGVTLHIANNTGAAGTLALTVNDLPGVLEVTGLPSSVSLSHGQSQSIPLTLNAGDEHAFREAMETSNETLNLNPSCFTPTVVIEATVLSGPVPTYACAVDNGEEFGVVVTPLLCTGVPASRPWGLMWLAVAVASIAMWQWRRPNSWIRQG